MAFIYREEKLKNIRPNTALGPGEYLPISKDKKFKNNNMNAPFESNVKRFNPLYGELNSIRNATPGPGKYYSNELRLKTKKLENLAKIKYSNMEDFIPNKSQKGYNFYPAKEKLGFDIKAQRFKIDSNSNPGPGEYFNTKKNKNFKESKKRARSALYLNNLLRIYLTENILLFEIATSSWDLKRLIIMLLKKTFLFHRSLIGIMALKQEKIIL